MASAVSAPLRVSTGISGLDDVLHGGLTPNRLYLVEGNPGAGKTTIALQFLMEAARAGERCLYITLSETQEELLAAAASHGWKLDGIAIVELAPDPSDLEGETTRKIIDAVEKHAPTRVVFDSLSEMRLLAQSPLRYRRQILALKQFLLGRHCTALFLDDRVGQGEDVMLHSIAHGVISLEHAPPIYGATRRLSRHVDQARRSRGVSTPGRGGA